MKESRRFILQFKHRTFASFHKIMGKKFHILQAHSMNTIKIRALAIWYNVGTTKSTLMPE